LKEWTAPDSQNMPSTTNLEEEETMDAPGNDGNASIPEQVKLPNPWRKMMITITGIKHFGLAHRGWAVQGRNTSTGTTGEKTPLHGFITGRLLV